MFDFDIVTTVEEARFLLDVPVVAFDIETDARDYHWKDSWKRGTSYNADISHISLYAGSDHPAVVFTASRYPVVREFETIEFNEFEEPYRTTISVEMVEHVFPDDVFEFIKAVFSSPKVFVAHTLTFDARQIYGKWGIEIPDGATLFDTEAQAVTGMWYGRNYTTGLEPVYSRFYTMTPEQHAWVKKMKSKRKQLHKLEPADVEVYAAWDSVAAYQLWRAFQDEPKYKGYEEQLLVDLEYTKLATKLSIQGMRVDREYAWDLLMDLYPRWVGALHDVGLSVQTEHLSRDRKWIPGYVFSQLKESPSEDDIREYGLRTKTGAWSFASKAMDYYLEQVEELVYLKTLREIEKEISDIETALRHSEYDGYIHSILSRKAITGRNTSSSPNNQNLNMDVVKGVYVADTDDQHQLIELDASNAENWFAAAYARENGMAAACASEDMHTSMAIQYFGRDLYESMTDEEWDHGPRAQSKSVTFGTAYGMGINALARKLKMSVVEARALLDLKDRTFPRVAELKKNAAKWAEKHESIAIWDGRTVAIKKAYNDYSEKVEVKGYTAINSLNQGGVGSLIVRAMLSIDSLLRDKYPRSRIVLQVHDSIIVNLHIDDYPHAVQEMIDIMATTVPDDFNNRTVPACRWLSTLDNYANAKKWGYRHNHDYLLPIYEYVNRWGVHHYEEGQHKAPTWINQWGYGEEALQRELDLIQPEEEEVSEQPSEFNWMGFYQAVRFLSLSMTPVNGVPFADWVEGTPAQRNCLDFIDMIRHSGLVYGDIEVDEPFTWAGFKRRIDELARITIPMRFVNGKVYEFPEAMTIREELFKRGYDVEPLYTVMDRISELIVYTEGVEVNV